MKCPRRYQLEFEKGWRVEGHSDALDFGSLLHECLAAHYHESDEILNETDDEEADARYERYQLRSRWQQLLDAVEGCGHEWWIEQVDRVRHMMSGYLTAYPMNDDTFLQHPLVAIEEYHEVHKPFDFSTRMDLVYRSAAGIWIVDHKTSRAMTDDLVSGWSLNGQMLGLLYMAHNKWPKERVLGLVINVIVRTKEPQFRRVQIPYKPELVREWVRKMKIWTQMDTVYSLIKWPPNYSACIHRYGRCPFYWYCENGDTENIVTGRKR